MKIINWLKVILVGLMLYYYSRFLVYDDFYFSFLDYINLCFHEAGHVFLCPFGRSICLLGGTISQIFWPVFIAIYFYRTNQIFSSYLSIFWIGENFLNISFYVGDAVKQEFPLVGGGEHDWANFFLEHNIIQYSHAISKIIFITGSIIIFFSIFLILKSMFKKS